MSVRFAVLFLSSFRRLDPCSTAVRRRVEGRRKAPSLSLSLSQTTIIITLKTSQTPPTSQRELHQEDANPELSTQGFPTRNALYTRRRDVDAILRHERKGRGEQRGLLRAVWEGGQETRSVERGRGGCGEAVGGE